MHYEWSSELEMGFPAIDEQHKQLVTAVNDLLLACKHGCHQMELKKTLDFLISYTVKHFTDEEAFQLEHNYPDYERHKQLHENFKRVAVDLAERLQKNGPTVCLIAEVHSTIGGWLVTHIKGEDLQIAQHVRGEA